MRRRRLLAVLAAASSGCLGDGDTDARENNAGTGANRTGGDETDGNRTDGAEDEETTEDEKEGDGTREAVRVRDRMLQRIPPAGNDIVVEFETVGLTAAGYDRIASLAEDGDAGGPPILRTVWVNDGDETSTCELTSLPPYDGVAENEDGDVLYAVPTESHDLADETPTVECDGGAWYLNGEYDRDEWLPETVELAPETGYVGEYALASDDGELSGGTYPFGGGETDSPHEDGLTVTTWQTNSPGPSVESRFEGEGLPTSAVGKRLDLYHEADEGTEVYLEPSKEVVELPSEEGEGAGDDGATVDFRLVNRSEGVGSLLHASFTLHKMADGSWETVTTNLGVRPGEFESITPGETTTRRLRLFHSLEGRERSESGAVAGGYSQIEDLEGDGISDDIVLGPLGGGVYAYDLNTSIDGYHPVAAFEVDAPTLNVEPPVDASSERNGDTVEVSAVKDDSGVAGFVVRRSEDGEDAPTIPPESLYGVDIGLRYALPFFEDGVDRVRVTADRRTVDHVFFRTGDQMRFVYDGTVYSAERT
jgi:hypothetical protein